MAKQVNVRLVDDVDGETAATETIAFSIEGTNYEIDLCTKNADKFRKDVSTWINHARKVAGRKGRQLTSSTSASREELAAVRAWARENGHTVSDRGRIPADVIAAYHNRATKSDKDRVATALSKVKTVDQPDLAEAK